jgi:hypothetical protein
VEKLAREPASRTVTAARAMTDGPQELAASHRRGTRRLDCAISQVLFGELTRGPLLHAFYAFEAELRDTIGASHDIAHIACSGGTTS